MLSKVSYKAIGLITFVVVILWCRTLIIHSVLAKNLEILKWLIANRADVNHKDNLGWSALHHAAQQHLPEIAGELIEGGANINAQDEHGNSVLWRAVFASKGRGEIIALLLQRGADVKMKNTLVV